MNDTLVPKSKADRNARRRAEQLVHDAGPAVWAKIVARALGIEACPPAYQQRCLELVGSRTMAELRRIEAVVDPGSHGTDDVERVETKDMLREAVRLLVLQGGGKPHAIDVPSEVVEPAGDADVAAG